MNGPERHFCKTIHTTKRIKTCCYVGYLNILSRKSDLFLKQVNFAQQALLIIYLLCLRYNPNSINCHQTKLWIKRTLISVTFGRPVFFAINENQICFFSLSSLLVFKSIKCEYFFLQISAISIPRKLILRKAVVSAYWSRIFIRIIKCWLWRFWTLNTYTAPLLTSDKVFVRYLSLLKSTVLLVFWPTLERQ